MERISLTARLVLAGALLLPGTARALFGSKDKKTSQAIYSENRDWAEERLKWTSVHRPLKYRDCAACHASSKELNKMLWPAEKLCSKCHSVIVESLKAENPKEKIHGALNATGCSTCHDPHASREKHLMKEGAAKLCLSCHESGGAGMKAAHFGVTKFRESCLVCHVGHSSPKAKLLPDAPMHPPFEQRSCGVCHAESQGGEMRLKEDLSETCVACHPGLDEEKPGETKPHLPKDGIFCFDCHSGHLIRFRGMQKPEPAKACQACHEDIPDKNHPQFDHPSHKKGAPDPLRENAEFDCATCHDPHAASGGKLLRRPFDQKTCLECHPQ